MSDLSDLQNIRPIHADVNDTNTVIEAMKTSQASTVFVLPPAVETREQSVGAGASHVVTVSTGIADLPETVFGGQMSYLEKNIYSRRASRLRCYVFPLHKWHLSSCEEVKQKSTSKTKCSIYWNKCRV